MSVVLLFRPIRKDQLLFRPIPKFDLKLVSVLYLKLKLVSLTSIVKTSLDLTDSSLVSNEKNQFGSDSSSFPTHLVCA